MSVGGESGCQRWKSVNNYSGQIALSESVRELGFEAFNWPVKGIEYGIALQRLFRYHEELSFLKRSQARCCLPSFSTSKVHYLLNSSSTKEPLTVICTVRHSKAYAGLSRTKDKIWSRKVWF